MRCPPQGHPQPWPGPAGGGSAGSAQPRRHSQPHGPAWHLRLANGCWGPRDCLSACTRDRGAPAPSPRALPWSPRAKTGALFSISSADSQGHGGLMAAQWPQRRLLCHPVPVLPQCKGPGWAQAASGLWHSVPVLCSEALSWTSVPAAACPRWAMGPGPCSTSLVLSALTQPGVIPQFEHILAPRWPMWLPMVLGQGRLRQGMLCLSLQRLGWCQGGHGWSLCSALHATGVCQGSRAVPAGCSSSGNDHGSSLAAP